jgi:hypothetical protein
LDGRKLAKKLIRGHLLRRWSPAGEAYTSGHPTYAEAFEDLLDPRAMRSAFLYEPRALQALVESQRAEHLHSTSPLNLMIGIEVVLRAATRLQTGRAN